MDAPGENLDGWFPTDEQVGQVLQLLQQEFGAGLFNLTEPALGACEAAFRFSALARCLKLAREQHGVAAAAVARTLAVGPAKLKSMENGGVPEAALLLRYVNYLGLDDYYAAWRKANPKLAEVFETEAAAAGILEIPPAVPSGNGHAAGQLPPFPRLKSNIGTPQPLPRVSKLPPPPAFPDVPPPTRQAVPDPTGFFGVSPVAAADAAFGPPGANSAPPAVYQFKVTLRQLQPPVWRRIQVPNSITLFQLHEVLQTVMGWENCHLHEFVIRKTNFGQPDPEYGRPILSEDAYRLCDLGLKVKASFDYAYDFGDDWRHQLVLEKTLPPAPENTAVCLAGARACPLEDSGGPWGYTDKLEILLHPKRPDPDDIRGWIGPGFDPERFNLEVVNKRLAGLSHSWSKPKRKPRKSSS